MCGGAGTRLRPLTFDRPKPCMPILNKPSIGHLVDHLSGLGFDDVVMTVGYKGGDIEGALGDGSSWEVNIQYVYEDTPLGTAGSVKNARALLGDEPFLVVGGDHLLDLDLREMVQFHEQSREQNNAVVTIALLEAEDPTEYGIVNIDANHVIQRFLEKPSPGEIFSNLISAGIYVCEPEILDLVPDDTKFDFAKNLFPLLMERCDALCGWLASGYWNDVGDPTSYRDAVKWMFNRIQDTEIGDNPHMEGARVHDPVRVGHDVSLEHGSEVVGPIVIGNNSTVGAKTLIGPYASIGNDCVIGEASQILSGVLYDRVHVGSGSSISGAVVDNDVSIGANCSVENGAIIGPRATIGDDVKIQSVVRIWPDVSIEKGETVTEDVFNDDYEVDTGGS